MLDNKHRYLTFLAKTNRLHSFAKVFIPFCTSLEYHRLVTLVYSMTKYIEVRDTVLIQFLVNSF